jgi:Uma2 family endonuclease
MLASCLLSVLTFLAPFAIIRKNIQGLKMRNQALKIDERFTYQDYLHLPDDGKRYQIISGDLVMVPAPTPYHQKVSRNIERILYDYASEHGGEVLHAPCDVILSDVDVVQPDIIYISRERLSIIREKNIQGAPDLVVEVISPYSDKIDRISKTKLYARFGVKEYWIADVEREEVVVLHLKGEAYKRIGIFGLGEAFESRLLKGLTIRVSEVFPS